MRTSLRKDFILLLALLALCLPREAFGKDKETKETKEEEVVDESGISLGVRAGYALPMGTVAKDAMLNGATDLSKSASGMIPLGVDLGYRLDRHWYVGAAFTYGFLSTSGDLCNRITGGGAGCTSSGNDIRVGATVRYTINPEAKLAPWISAGAAYEVLNLSVAVGSQSADAANKGWEFVNAQIGADYRLATHAVIGPMIGMSLGQYNSYSASRSNGWSQTGDYNQSALHHWVFLGIQGRYDL